MLAQKDESDANHRLEITRLREQERRLGQDFARAQEQNKTLIEDNRSLASELVMYQEDAKAMSETLVIKDAEVSSLVRRVPKSHTLPFHRPVMYDKFVKLSTQRKGKLRACVHPQ